jgi:exopolyphosphatase/guanosine-5'-triphosphate,3'-diphosphate pyrophosphatase
MKPQAYVQPGAQTDGDLLAVIDLGTNTFNLVIVRLNEFDTFHVVEKIKEAVRLGEGGVNQDVIAPAAFARGLQALRNFRQVLDARGVRQVIACATSAIRSAANGSDFVQAVREETGIEIRTITGGDEAWLIYQGVRHGINLPFDETVLMIDIGGGSVEFVAAMRSQVKLMRSLNIGVQRVFERFKPSDPVTPATLQAIQEHYREALAAQHPYPYRFIRYV